jgi:hypothetical protein
MMNCYRQMGVICALIVTGLFPGVAGQVCASEMVFKPSLSVSEEINDNVYEISSSKRTDYITRVQPGASLHYLTPFWSWDTAYTFSYNNYARHSRDDEFNHDAALKGNIALIDNFFYLDLSETYHRVSQNVARDVTTSSSLFVNQTDQNIAAVSPYLLWKIGTKSTLKTGYRYTDTRYWDATSIDKRENGAFADFTYELTSKLSLTSGYAFTRSETQPVRFDRHDVYGGFKYQYADKSFLSGQFGKSWQLFNKANDVSYYFWNANITHDFEVVTVTLETKAQNTEDPLSVSTKETDYSGKIDKVLQRGALGLSSTYSEFVHTQTGISSQRKLSFNGYGRHEIMPSLTMNLSATAEHYYIISTGDFPYRLVVTTGLTYAFNHDITLSMTYSYDTSRNEIGTTAGSKEINRGIVELKKVF